VGCVQRERAWPCIVGLWSLSGGEDKRGLAVVAVVKVKVEVNDVALAAVEVIELVD
jgi:hypothetical protein